MSFQSVYKFTKTKKIIFKLKSQKLYIKVTVILFISGEKLHNFIDKINQTMKQIQKHIHTYKENYISEKKRCEKGQQVKTQHHQLLLQRATGETGWTGSEMPDFKVEITSRRCDNQRVRDPWPFKDEGQGPWSEIDILCYVFLLVILQPTYTILVLVNL